MSAGIPTPDSKQFGQRMREFALVGLGLLGDRKDAFLRVRDLEAAGLALARPSFVAKGGGPKLGGPGPAVQPVYVEDLTPPPAPSSFSATSGVTQILFETAAPIYTQGHGHARTKIYSASWDGVSPLPTFGDAVQYTDFAGNIGVAPFDPASTLRLWATWTSADGVESVPAGGTNGIAAATSLLEDQHIANVSAGKLLAGSIAVGQYIQSADYVAGVSGWRIATLVGGGAFVEIRGNAVFGGTVYASAGSLGDLSVVGNITVGYLGAIKGGQTAFNTGTGFFIGNEGGTYKLSIGNGVKGLTWDGANLNINGGGTFSGALSAATGTFAGSLSAATGTFAGNLSAAGGTFSGALSAATGTFSGNLSAAGGTFAGTLTAQVVQTTNIVGAAVTTTASASGSSSASCALTAPAGSSSIIFLVDPGTWDLGGGEGSTGSMSVQQNGSPIYSSPSRPGFMMYSIDGPAAATYTLTANGDNASNRVRDVRCAILLTKR